MSPDTDILILLVHFARQVGGPIRLKLSKGDRLFPAHIIAQNMTPTLCQMLPSFTQGLRHNQLFCKAGRTETMETA